MEVFETGIKGIETSIGRWMISVPNCLLVFLSEVGKLLDEALKEKMREDGYKHTLMKCLKTSNKGCIDRTIAKTFHYDVTEIIALGEVSWGQKFLRDREAKEKGQGWEPARMDMRLEGTIEAKLPNEMRAWTRHEKTVEIREMWMKVKKGYEELNNQRMGQYCKNELQKQNCIYGYEDVWIADRTYADMFLHHEFAYMIEREHEAEFLRGNPEEDDVDDYAFPGDSALTNKLVMRAGMRFLNKLFESLNPPGQPDGFPYMAPWFQIGDKVVSAVTTTQGHTIHVHAEDEVAKIHSREMMERVNQQAL
jgi:hypothetical protein